MLNAVRRPGSERRRLGWAKTLLLAGLGRRAGRFLLSLQPGGAALRGSANLQSLAAVLSLQTDRPVLDRTGLTGVYDSAQPLTSPFQETTMRPRSLALVLCFALGGLALAQAPAPTAFDSGADAAKQVETSTLRQERRRNSSAVVTRNQSRALIISAFPAALQLSASARPLRRAGVRKRPAFPAALPA